MLETTLQIDDSRFQRLLAELVEETRFKTQDAVIIGAGIAARAAGEVSWPKQGKMEKYERSLVGQIRRVYAVPGDGFKDIMNNGHPKAAGAYWALIQKNHFGRAEKILRKWGNELKGIQGLNISKFDKGALHMRLRTARGRIGRSVKPKFMVQNYKGKKAGSNPLETYIAHRKGMIGFTQAAWYNCLRLLGRRNRRSKENAGVTQLTTPFPSWVVRHKKTKFGKVIVGGTPQAPTITIHNDTPWSAKVLGDGAMDYIKLKAINEMRKFMEITLFKTRNG